MMKEKITKAFEKLEEEGAALRKLNKNKYAGGEEYFPEDNAAAVCCWISKVRNLIEIVTSGRGAHSRSFEEAYKKRDPLEQYTVADFEILYGAFSAVRGDWEGGHDERNRVHCVGGKLRGVFGYGPRMP